MAVTRAAAPVNLAPTADAGSPQTVNRGETVTLDASGSSDPENDALTYSWARTAGPSVTLTNASSVRASFTAPSTPTSLTFRVTVTDAQGNQDTDDVTISVRNRAPTAYAGVAQTVNFGTVVTLDASGSSDPDGDGLNYGWYQLSGTTVSIVDSASARPSLAAPSSAATLTFRLTVSDGYGGNDTDDVTVTVQQVLDFSALPGYGDATDFLDNSYGSMHTLTDFDGTDLNAVTAFTTSSDSSVFGIQGPLIPNVTGQLDTEIPFFSMWVEEYEITSSQGVVSQRKRLRTRIYNSSIMISSWLANSAWDISVEFQPVGGSWQEVFTDSNEDLLDAGFSSATASQPPSSNRAMTFVQITESNISQAEYEAFKSFFMTDALSEYNVRIRVALD